MRIILSTEALGKLRLSKLNVKYTFVHNKEGKCDVYGVPPRESSDRGRRFWILLTAAYGLINSNAKWQVLSESLPTYIDFS